MKLTFLVSSSIPLFIDAKHILTTQQTKEMDPGRTYNMYGSSINNILYYRFIDFTSMVDLKYQTLN